MILTLDHDDPARELAFELDFMQSLSVQDRFRMMLLRSDEMKRTLLRHGHRRPAEILKRPLR